MAKINVIDKPVLGISETAARLSFGTAALFVILLAALHFIKPELDPSWRFISEYAIGDFGWMMALAFLSLALSYVSLFIAIRSQLRTLGGRIGLALLLISAAGLSMAGLFTTDPITAGPEAMTTEGFLHSLGGTLGFAMPFAALIVSWSLARNPSWVSAWRALFWSTGLALFGFLVSFLSLGIMFSQSGGKPGPNVLVGWPTRFEILTYCVWLMALARYAARVGGEIR